MCSWARTEGGTSECSGTGPINQSIDRGSAMAHSVFSVRWKAASDYSGKKKTNKHKHFWQDGGRDKQEPSLGQMGPLPGTKWDPSLGQTGLSLLSSTVKSPFCPVCPWDGWGFVPGTIVPQEPSEKCLCVFCSLSVEISCVFPQENKVFQRPCRIILLLSYFFPVP